MGAVSAVEAPAPSPPLASAVEHEHRSRCQAGGHEASTIRAQVLDEGKGHGRTARRTIRVHHTRTRPHEDETKRRAGRGDR